MHSREGDPLTTQQAGIDLANDRRRAGRPAAVHPNLRALLRGHVDPDAPPDPVISKPSKVAFDAELVRGALLATALLLIGAILRFSV